VAGVPRARMSRQYLLGPAVLYIQDRQLQVRTFASTVSAVLGYIIRFTNHRLLRLLTKEYHIEIVSARVYLNHGGHGGVGSR